MKSKLCLLIFLLSCTAVDDEVATSHRKKNIEIEDQQYLPTMVGPNIISKSYFEGHASITSKGDEIYFAVYTNDHSYSTIAYSKYFEDSWQEPQIISFSGVYSDGSPAISPDGRKLFFSSRRPKSNSVNMNTSNDIWYSLRTNEGWAKPVRLPDGVNSSFNEFSPSVDAHGNLYFCSNRPNGYGDMDVYFSEFSNGNYLEPILLDSTINSQYHEGNVGVSPDGNLLFLMIQHKPGDFGYDDIHYSYKIEGEWAPVKNVDSIVNTYSYDFSPKVSPSGEWLYFSSRINRNYNLTDTPYTYNSFESYLNSPLNGLGNIYKIEIDKLELKRE